MLALAQRSSCVLALRCCCALLLALGACEDHVVELVPFPPASATVDVACAPEAAACVTDKDCCPSPPTPVHCLEDAPGVHLFHCAADPPKGCHADAEPCAHGKDCCGGYCVPDATGTLTCSSVCRALGQACMGPADCCAGLGCPPADGGQLCATMP